MHTIDLLEEALQLAADSGFEIRLEWLAGTAGGACRLGSKKILFVDLSLTAAEQLQQVIEPLRTSNIAVNKDLSSPLRKLLGHGNA